MKRLVAAEWLDQLAPSERLAVESRRDLRRLNFWMGHPRRMQNVLRQLFAGHPPRRLAELGAGDGTFLLRLARSLGREWPDVEVFLVDQHAAVSSRVRKEIEACGWKVVIVVADVFDWLKEEHRLDGMLANLFLHHFDAEDLERLLALASRCAGAFVACEPRRSPASLLTGPLLWLLGCNSVTRHDAPISVRAGFRGKELSSRWPCVHWELREEAAGLFSHLFVARRRAA